MAHAHKVPCSRCGQQLEDTASTCPHCGAARSLASGPSEVPPALAIVVALSLLAGVAALILLLARAPGSHHESPPAPIATASAEAAPKLSAPPSPAATPRAEHSPSPAATPAKVLPSSPEPGKPPQKLGVPPAPEPHYGASPAPHGDGPQFPGYR